MSATHHVATVAWSRGSAAFSDGRYSRAHVWRFDGVPEVAASASPHIVPLPLSREDAVDPEEAFVASLSSCHMLWFLSAAAKAGFVVESYEDEAVGEMGRDPLGRVAMLRVRLGPRITWSGPRRPSAPEVAALHDAAHDECFLASSVRSQIVVEPR